MHGAPKVRRHPSLGQRPRLRPHNERALTGRLILERPLLRDAALVSRRVLFASETRSCGSGFLTQGIRSLMQGSRFLTHGSRSLTQGGRFFRHGGKFLGRGGRFLTQRSWFLFTGSGFFSSGSLNVSRGAAVGLCDLRLVSGAHASGAMGVYYPKNGS